MMNGNQSRKNFRLQLKNNPEINGFDTFKRTLEKEYFAKVNIRNCNPADQEQGSVSLWNLVVEMECNFELVEILYYLDKGSWGSPAFPVTSAGIPNSALNDAFCSIEGLNSQEVDIDEISLVLKDSIIVVKRIYERSIAEQFGQILQTLAAHYVFFTRELTETPYEIYLPVFEEEILNVNSLVSTVKRDTESAGDYYKYWALYFDSSPEAKIYELESRSIISGDLHMLNQ